MYIKVFQKVLDNSFEHRILLDNHLYGVENLYQLFSNQEWHEFLNLMLMNPSGTYKNFTWERE